MKAKKALKRLKKVETILSNVIDQFAVLVQPAGRTEAEGSIFRTLRGAVNVAMLRLEVS